jgi:hypothetical protein
MASTPPDLIPVTINSIPIAPFAECVSRPNGFVETSPEVALFWRFPVFSSNLAPLTFNLVAESLAPIQQAQLLLVAGFVMLGWVLARRQIKSRRQLNQNARVANKAVKAIRDYKEPAVPLAGAPVETQRWQAAMFDLQRELKADLDTRIVIVQTLLQQVDQRIDRLENLQRALRQPNQKSAS